MMCYLPNKKKFVIKVSYDLSSFTDTNGIGVKLEEKIKMFDVLDIASVCVALNFKPENNYEHRVRKNIKDKTEVVKINPRTKK